MDAAIMLLDAGADVNHSDLDGYTPLIEAAHGGHLEMLRLLLRRGAKHDASFYVEADGMSIGGTAEDMAKAQGHDECVTLLSGVRLAGGWKKWVSIPRKQLVVLRVLCERGRRAASHVSLRYGSLRAHASLCSTGHFPIVSHACCKPVAALRRELHPTWLAAVRH